MLKARVLLLVAVSAGLLAAALSAAASGGGITAHLVSPLPLAARPGAAIRVELRLHAAASGRRVVVRLLSRTGARSTSAPAEAIPGRRDAYEAATTVPAGGIGGIRVELRARTGALPIDNDPFATAAGVRCDVEAMRTTLTAFVRAYNRGDLERLDRLFSRDRFHLYASSGPGVREPPNAQKRGTLIAYFRQRHRAADRLVVQRFRFNSYERARNVGHFEFDGSRRADDFRGGASFGMTGKGALDCSSRPITLALVYLGRAEP